MRRLNERGFMLLNVVFLTLITSFAAMILMNVAPRVKNPHETLRLTALYLANEQFAYLESFAASGKPLSGNFHGEKDDLTTKNLSEENPIELKVTTNFNGNKATVTVKWEVGNKNFELVQERAIGIVP